MDSIEAHGPPNSPSEGHSFVVLRLAVTNLVGLELIGKSVVLAEHEQHRHPRVLDFADERAHPRGDLPANVVHVDHRTKRVALPDVVKHERLPHPLPDLRHLVIARRQPRQVRDDQLVVHPHHVHRPRLPGDRRRAREVLLAQQVVDQRRLARVRLSSDAHVRQLAQLEEPLREHLRVGARQHLHVVPVVAHEEVALLAGCRR
mmetsp:Transcript_30473/g.63931  ORF Transcript_30473/g.63931 Transcript_30473/m.63931 type:complete len:203 (+) Transcript_30473:502-1110(+)